MIKNVKSRLKPAAMLVVSIVVTVLVIAMLIGTQPVHRAEVQETVPVTVHVTGIARMDVLPITRITGILRPARISNLHFEGSGTIHSRHAEPGQHVSAGDLLLSIDPGPAEDDVTEAEARLQQEYAAIKRDRELLSLLTRNRILQEKEVKRLKRLRTDALASGSQYEVSQQKLLQMQVDEEKLRDSVAQGKTRIAIRQTALSRANRNLDRTRLTAPFSGVVDTVHLDLGDYATPGQVALTLVQDQELDLLAEVDQRQAALLSLGTSVIIDTGSREIEGRIHALQRTPKADTLTYPVRIRISGDGLIPGQTATALLPGKRLTQALSIPATALLHDEGKTYIFVVEANRLRKMAVQAIYRQGDRQIIDGPADDDTLIVASDVAALGDGQPVRYTLDSEQPG